MNNKRKLKFHTKQRKYVNRLLTKDRNEIKQKKPAAPRTLNVMESTAPSFEV